MIVGLKIKLVSVKIVFRKTHQYCCHQCNKQFDWDEGKSVVYGKPEYKTIQEKRAIEKFFCTEICYYKWKGLI